MGKEYLMSSSHIIDSLKRSLKIYTFEGGVHPRYNKNSAESKIKEAKIPKKIYLPLSQHIGAPCVPIVKVGDKVKVGQKVAESEAFVSSPIYSSISGKVISVDLDIDNPTTKKKVKSIVIESDGKDDHVSFKTNEIQKLSNEQILEIVKESGIVGLGGAGFPTHVKLSPPDKSKIDTLIINGAECEPYLTNDYRCILEYTEELIQGTLILDRVLEVKNIFIGVENNKLKAIKILTKILKEKKLSKIIKVVKVPTCYPQGAEKTLIKALTGRKIPVGKLPMDVGCVCVNVGTAISIKRAIVDGQPLYKKVITVSGKVKRPSNLKVRIGTPINEIVSQCGGYVGKPVRLIAGGPMMGVSLSNDEFPILKSSSGFIVYNKEDVKNELKFKESPCIRCAKCINSCPMKIMPTMITQAVKKKDTDMLESLHVMNCFECGCCSFICPVRIPLTSYMKKGKKLLTQKKKLEEFQKQQKEKKLNEEKAKKANEKDIEKKET